jgi:type I restriction enzyme S subunit
MITTRLSELKPVLESGSRPKGGVRNGLGEIPSLGAEHLDSQGGFNFKKLKKVSKIFYSEMNKGIIRKNDILIVKDGATTGKVSFVDSQFPFVEASINEHVFILRINEIETFPKYIFWHLFCSKGQNQILKDFRGATVGGISRGFLNNIKIPLPPLPEQKRIASILKKADGIRKKREEALHLADSFLLATFLKMFGDPVTNPKGWEVKSLLKLTDKIGSGATPRGGKSAYISQGISLIRSLNVHDDKFIKKNLAFITNEQADALANVVVKKSDVLLNITGASVCRSAVVLQDILPARVNQHVCIIRPYKSRLCSTYLLHCLISNNYKKKLLSLAGAGGATREALTKKQVENLKIPIPPIELQNKFAEIETRIKNIKTANSNFSEQPLFEVLTQLAFRGEL